MNIRLSGVLLRFVGYRRQFTVEATTVSDGLKALSAQFDQLNGVLFDGEGNVRTTHRLFLNGDQVDQRELHKFVAPQDTLEILTALAGG
jgi:molybdopterin synthase sulfur carrier subunit